MDDLILIHEWAVKQYPELPHILLGHSMGSWIAMSALQKVTDFNAALISGSSKPQVLETFIQKLLVRFETMRLGPSGYSNFSIKLFLEVLMRSLRIRIRPMTGSQEINQV